MCLPAREPHAAPVQQGPVQQITKGAEHSVQPQFYLVHCRATRTLNFVEEFCRAFRRLTRTYSLADYLVVVESDVNL